METIVEGGRDRFVWSRGLVCCGSRKVDYGRGSVRDDQRKSIDLKTSKRDSLTALNHTGRYGIGAFLRVHEQAEPDTAHPAPLVPNDIPKRLIMDSSRFNEHLTIHRPHCAGFSLDRFIAVRWRRPESALATGPGLRR